MIQRPANQLMLIAKVATRAVAVALVLWGVGLAGLLNDATGPVYDLSLRIASNMVKREPRVVLISLNQDQVQDPVVVNRVIQEVLSTGATGLVCLPPVSEALIPAGGLVNDGPRRVILARSMQRLQGTGPWTLAAGVTDVDGYFAGGGAAAPPSGSSVFRQQWARFVLSDGSVVPSAEVIAADLNQDSASVGEDFRIFFIGGPQSLPRVNGDQVLNKALISGLADGRWVIAGLAAGPLEAGLSVPTGTSGSTMSALEHHGHALQTLLDRSWIKDLHPGGSLALLVAIALATIGVYSKVPVRLSIMILLVAVSVTFAFTVALLAVFSLWLPVIEMILVQAFMVALILHRRGTDAEAALRKLMLEFASAQHDRVLPPAFTAETNPWPMVVTVLNHVLSLDRVIILEPIPGAKRLREVQAMGCDLHDISERRRDIERSPYSTAIAKGRFIRLEDRDFFANRDSMSGDQYIVPLILGGRVLGFLAAEIAGDSTVDRSNLEAILSSSASHLAELLYHREQVAGSQISKHAWIKDLTLSRESASYQTVLTAADLIKERFNRIDSVLAGISSAIIVFDIFGRVFESNHQMQEALADENLAVYDLTSLELAAAITNLSKSKLRDLFRYIITTGNRGRIHAQLSSQPGRFYILNIVPIDLAATPKAPQIAVTGMMFELVDITAAARLDDLKRALVDHLGAQMRSDLATAHLSSTLLSKPDTDETQRRQLPAAIIARIDSALARLDNAENLLAGAQSVERLVTFPVDVRIAMMAAAEAAGLKLSARSVEVHVDQPEIPTFTLAAPEELPVAIAAFLELVATDAVAGSIIRAEVRETGKWIELKLMSSGAGLPDKILRRFLEHGPIEGAGTTSIGRQAVGWIRQWGGDVTASSRVGSGTTVVVRLHGLS